VVLLPYLGFAPFFIAQEEGYFVEQGLEIEFVKLDSAEEAIPLLAGGKLDVLSGTISPGLLNAVARGAAVKIVAGKGYLASTGCAYFAALARRALVADGQLDGPIQLQGRPFALDDPASFDGYATERLLNMMGQTLDGIEIVAVPPPVMPEALEAGTIDFAMAVEPWVTRILQSGHAAVWMPVQQAIPDYQIAFNMYGPTLLEENRDAGRRFTVAYLKAVRQFNQGKTERNLEILAKHTELDKELLLDACWPSFHNDGAINMQGLLEFQEWALEKDYLDSPVTEEQMWDPSFIEYATDVLGTPSE
jgi:NitT/TauT family transport system substrate-binding protein